MRARGFGSQFGPPQAMMMGGMGGGMMGGLGPMVGGMGMMSPPGQVAMMPPPGQMGMPTPGANMMGGRSEVLEREKPLPLPLFCLQTPQCAAPISCNASTAIGRQRNRQIARIECSTVLQINLLRRSRSRPRPPCACQGRCPRHMAAPSPQRKSRDISTMAARCPRRHCARKGGRGAGRRRPS